LTLIKSISGFRGTIGGKSGDNLTAADIVACTAAYGSWILETGKPAKVIVGRDGRISGNIVSNLAVNTLLTLGIDVVDLGHSTTPTVEMMVPDLSAGGGIIFTASHNPKQWNALKFLNDKGEFISGEEGVRILALEKEASTIYADVDNLGSYTKKKDAIALHIEKILALDIIDVEVIKRKKFKVVVDCINSTGSY
jgi:phosphomannomutase